MAREESSREDLLGEAVALVERIELVQRGSATSTLSSIVPQTPIVAGFRASGSLSLFFGEDPVYQFNSHGELRRAYRCGLLYKAVRGRLASLRRDRSELKTELVRRDLTIAEQTNLVNDMLAHLRDFAALLSSGDFDVNGQVPSNADVLGRLRSWLVTHNGLPIARRPNVVPPQPSAEKR
jgi:hypothetical protein